MVVDSILGPEVEIRPYCVIERALVGEGCKVGPFARLREASVAIRSRHPQADWISAGMSGDLEAAVRNGATHLRVGSAILGSRPLTR